MRRPKGRLPQARRVDDLSVELYTGSIVAGGAASVAGSLYYATHAVRSQWLGRTDWRGRADIPSVSLTFDDGPAPDTPAILDVLREHGVRAAFFLVGRQVERYPGIARRILDEGHEIGNHSYSHPIYLYRRARVTRSELERAQEIITSATGRRPSLARPPCGVRTRAYFAAARELKLRTVQWTVAGFDWKRRSASEIAGAVLRSVAAGSIILLHDGDSRLKRDRRQTVAAVPLIISGLRDRNLEIEPLSGLLARMDGESSTGGRYW